MADQLNIPEKFKDAVDVCGNQKVLKLITKKPDVDNGRRPKQGVEATIHYTGTLLDGTKFDSSVDRGDPFKTEVGVGKVIKGWDAVMPTMAIGEKADVLIQSDYAYGESGSPPTIPPNAPLIFEMEMLGWSNEKIDPEGEGTIDKVVISSQGLADEDEPLAQMSEGQNVKMNVKVNCEHEHNDFEYVVGEEALHDWAQPGLQICVESMEKGEKSEFTLQANTKYNVTTSAIIYEIEILEADEWKKEWQMNDNEKLTMAKNFKERGNTLLKQSYFNIALKKYNLGLSLLNHLDQEESETELKEEWHSVKIAMWSNAALTSFKLKENKKCIEFADRILEEIPDHEKALFRKAEGFKNLAEDDLAIKFYKRVLKVNPDNKTASKSLNLVQRRKKAYVEAEKKKYAGLFK